MCSQALGLLLRLAVFLVIKHVCFLTSSLHINTSVLELHSCAFIDLIFHGKIKIKCLNVERLS